MTTVVSCSSIVSLASSFSKSPSLDDQSLHDEGVIRDDVTLHEDHAIHHQFIEYGKNAKEWLRKCALLLPEIERRKIWKKQGFSGVHEYAAKLAGMSRSSVDEALRVLKKVADKPALQRVIEEKGIQAVRPVVAIATPETAAFWANKARQMTKNTLETYVKEYKKDYSENSFKKFPREDFQLQNESLQNLKNPEIFSSPSLPSLPTNPTKEITMHLDSTNLAHPQKTDLVGPEIHDRSEGHGIQKSMIDRCKTRRFNKKVPRILA